MDILFCSTVQQEEWKNKVDIPLKNGYNTLTVVLLWLSR